MGDDKTKSFAERMNAQLEAEKKALADAADELKRREELMLREYPRLSKELVDRVRAKVTGIHGATVKLNEASLTFGSGDRMVAHDIVIELNGKPRVTFTHDITNSRVFNGWIDVAMEGRFPSKAIIVMVNSRTEQGKWMLATFNPHAAQKIGMNAAFELTDEALEEILSKGF